MSEPAPSSPAGGDTGSAHDHVDTSSVDWDAEWGAGPGDTSDHSPRNASLCNSSGNDIFTPAEAAATRTSAVVVPASSSSFSSAKPKLSVHPSRQVTFEAVGSQQTSSSPRNVTPVSREVALWLCVLATLTLTCTVAYACAADNDLGAVAASAYLYLAIFFLCLQVLPLPPAGTASQAVALHLRWLHYLGLVPLLCLLPLSAAASVHRGTQNPTPGLIATVVLSVLVILMCFGVVPTHLQALANSVVGQSAEQSTFVWVMDAILLPSNYVEALVFWIRGFPSAPLVDALGTPGSFLQQHHLAVRVLAWLTMIAGFAFFWVYTRHTQCLWRSDALRAMCSATVVVLDVTGNVQ